MSEERTEQLVSPEGWRIWDSDGNWLGDAIMRPGDAIDRPRWLPITPVASVLSIVDTRAEAIASLRRWRKAAQAKARRAELKALPDGSVGVDHGPLFTGLPQNGKRCEVFGCGRPLVFDGRTVRHQDETPS